MQTESIVANGVPVLIVGLLITQTLACASGVGLGGKDVRVPLTWIRGAGQKGSYGAGDYGREIQHGGLTRFYEVHVPASLDGKKPAAVVLVFHGGGGYPGGVRFESGMDNVADREGFLVVYPAGTNKRAFLKDRLLEWSDGRVYQDGAAKEVDDVGFVAALLDDLASLFAVDAGRVYACGYSNGAQFCNRLAQQLSTRVAAIAKVAGHRSPDDTFGNPPRAVSVMQFSGRLDEVGPYEGGAPKNFNPVFKTMLKPVEVAVREWAKFNGCPEKPASVQKVGKATETRYGPGRDGSEVVLWTLDDGGHTWPGGRKLPNADKFFGGVGPINQDVVAAEQMWAFFKRHSLAPPRAAKKSE